MTHNKILFAPTHFHRVYDAHRPTRWLVCNIAKLSSTESFTQEASEKTRFAGSSRADDVAQENVPSHFLLSALRFPWSRDFQSSRC